jgi:hypothetical protein
LYALVARVHDVFDSTMKRDLVIAVLALGAGAIAALLVLGSDRELSPTAVSAVLALVVGGPISGAA